MWKLMKDLQEASADGPQCIDLTFTRGVTSKLVVYKPSTEQRKVVGKATDVLDIFLQLNSLARAHGIGRIDIVKNQFIGVKSRGCYETPAGTINLVLFNMGMAAVVSKGRTQWKNKTKLEN
ncbi:hypothetical protein PtB15_11B224 [Puccinia triticina]|nr:hypothetical protein PtB15_11B224 [Puccinia triticina]